MDMNVYGSPEEDKVKETGDVPRRSVVRGRQNKYDRSYIVYLRTTFDLFVDNYLALRCLLVSHSPRVNIVFPHRNILTRVLKFNFFDLFHIAIPPALSR